ncbi:MAG: transcriptional repressor [Succinivibrionaceae bacterium]
MTKLNDNKEYMNECFTINAAKTECIKKLKEQSVRLSKQRLQLLDILFSGTFNCTKELYYIAQEQIPNLGMSTVYRFLKVLSDLGIISNNKILDINCYNCHFNLASFKDKEGRELKADGLSIQELVRLGLIVKGLIKSEEKIDVKVIDEGFYITVKDK